jgi:SAM-dependent methyltransferase
MTQFNESYPRLISQDGFSHQTRDQLTRVSARHIVRLVLNLCPAKNVIDLGCGVATWLSVFREFGVDDVIGVDAAKFDRALLQIPIERFIENDLTKPINLKRRFDLAMSLEVAEHLPPEFAPKFVASLVRLSDVVLFSAAIPGQGGYKSVSEKGSRGDFWSVTGK